MTWSITWNMSVKFYLRGSLCSISPLEDVIFLWKWNYPSGDPRFTPTYRCHFFSPLTLGHVGKFLIQMLANFCSSLEVPPVLTYLQFPQQQRTYPSEALHFFFSKAFIPLTCLPSPKLWQPALIVLPDYGWITCFPLLCNWASWCHWLHKSRFLIMFSHSKEISLQWGQTSWWLNSSSYWSDLMLTFRKNTFLLSLRIINKGADCLFKGIIICIS